MSKWTRCWVHRADVNEDLSLKAAPAIFVVLYLGDTQSSGASYFVPLYETEQGFLVIAVMEDLLKEVPRYVN